MTYFVDYLRVNRGNLNVLIPEFQFKVITNSIILLPNKIGKTSFNRMRKNFLSF